MHAIGDRAINMAVDAVAKARQLNGDSGRRHAIAHADVLNPQTIKRLRALNIVVNVTPLWIGASEELLAHYEPLLGEERMNWLYPFSSLHEAGVTVSVGSDFPVTTNNPFHAIEAAVTRRDPLDSAAQPLLLEQQLSRRQIVDMMTLGGARQLGKEDLLGSIEVGKVANLIALKDNLFDVDEDDISETEVAMTMLSGEVVYRAE